MGLVLPNKDVPEDREEGVVDALLQVGQSHPKTTPAGGSKSCHVRTYLFTVYWAADVENFKRLCEKMGAYVCAVIKVPFWNAWGSVVSGQYCIVYQHTEELEMEVLT